MQPEKFPQNKTEANLEKIAPEAVDFNVIGACNLDCLWCWGPDHKVKHTLSAQDWIEIGQQLKSRGTKSIVITGGEPLLRKDLLEITEGLKTMGMRVTLSTNGMLLQIDRNKELLKYIDDIGLPLDGSDPEVNSSMRKGDKSSFRLSLAAMKFVQENHPGVKLTVRTVLSKKNSSDIVNIPRVLVQNGIDVSKLRWKIYQIAPTGPRKFRILLEGDEWLIDDAEAEDVIGRIKQAHPEMTIQYQNIHNKLNRYLHVDPVGDLFTLVGNGTEEKSLGNIRDERGELGNLGPALKKLNDSEYRVTDVSHGSDNF